jgi:hypothetical protein
MAMVYENNDVDKNTLGNCLKLDERPNKEGVVPIYYKNSPFMLQLSPCEVKFYKNRIMMRLNETDKTFIEKLEKLICNKLCESAKKSTCLINFNVLDICCEKTVFFNEYHEQINVQSLLVDKITPLIHINHVSIMDNQVKLSINLLQGVVTVVNTELPDLSVCLIKGSKKPKTKSRQIKSKPISRTISQQESTNISRTGSSISSTQESTNISRTTSLSSSLCVQSDTDDDTDLESEHNSICSIKRHVKKSNPKLDMSLDDIIKQSKQEQYEQRKKQLDDDLFINILKF